MIEALLKKQISESNTHIASLRKEILELDDKILVEKAIIKEASECLQNICKHVETFVLSHYTPGGYDYRSETIRTLNCNNCNSVLGTSIEYGSFQ